MQKRVTVSELDAIIKRINIITGSPLEPYATGADGKAIPQAGNYHLSGAYGGYSLHRMVPSGGITDVFRCGHVTARELRDLMWAFITGLDTAKGDE